jgi:ABC-type sugar transport system ATPase subunit
MRMSSSGSRSTSNLPRMMAETMALIRALDVRAVVRDLSGGQRQGVAIARATHWASRLMLMDEPTAALGVAERESVERTIAGLRAQPRRFCTRWRRRVRPRSGSRRPGWGGRKLDRS